MALRIFSVTELTLLIKQEVEETFLDIWVEGEVSNLRMPSSGHIYLTLKDQESQLRAVIFRSSGRHLKFQPKDGQQILCRGHLTVYEPRGEYQLVVDYLEPKGIGALQLAFEQLKERLRAEGLFDEQRKRSLPMLPQRIGIITSRTGVVLHDILRILDRRFPNLSILIHPVAVQGEGAGDEIVRAIEDLNALSASGRGLDVLILARGGGSLEDLWSFNEEKVARAIAASRIPIISAVGHETDYTIADFVADLRAPTPSAAAELVVRPKQELIGWVQSLDERMKYALRVHLETQRSKLREMQRSILSPRKRLETFFLKLDELGWRSGQALVRLIREKRTSLRDRTQGLSSLRPDTRLKYWNILLGSRHSQLIQQMTSIIESRKATLAEVMGRMDSLSPLAVLARGYCIARRLPTLEVVREAKHVVSGDRLKLKLYRGELSCWVDKVRLEG
ncbi:MAG: exodeoxyribonuclease VII large subunit [Nitrospira sp.]|nr:exodeoxyribonuclease VII large subunit [Nitrospira sp.]